MNMLHLTANFFATIRFFLVQKILVCPAVPCLYTARHVRLAHQPCPGLPLFVKKDLVGPKWFSSSRYWGGSNLAVSLGSLNSSLVFNFLPIYILNRFLLSIIFCPTVSFSPIFIPEASYHSHPPPSGRLNDPEALNRSWHFSCGACESPSRPPRGLGSTARIWRCSCGWPSPPSWSACACRRSSPHIRSVLEGYPASLCYSG